MKLSIVIPQYKESEKMLRQTLNTIENQRGIDFKELEVLIVNDCSNYLPSADIGTDYSFKVKVMQTKKNGGAGLARQYGTERAKGKYILYLDADDCLISCISLRYIMAYDGNADIVKGKFFNETSNVVSDGWTWVHGKFYRKEFLKESGLRFPKELRVNEDGYFNMLAGAYAKEVLDIDEIITFWARNPNSITRENSAKFAVDCLDDFLKGKLMGFRELKRHNLIEQLRANLLDLFVYMYYYMQTREFYRGDYAVKIKQEKYESMIAEIIKEFWGEFKTFTENDIDRMLSQVYMQFKDYVDYRPRETFDEFRARIYAKGE